MFFWFQGGELLVQLGSFYGINQGYFPISKPSGMEIHFLESVLAFYVDNSVLKCQIGVTKRINGVP